MATVPVSRANYRRVPSKTHRRSCPFCGGQEIHRSRARGIIERHIVRTFRFYPHRCESCDRRFYVKLLASDLG